MGLGKGEWEAIGLGDQLLSKRLFANSAFKPTEALSSELVKPLLQRLTPDLVFPETHVKHLRALAGVIPTTTGLVDRPLYARQLELVQYAGPFVGTLALLLPAYVYAVDSVGVLLPNESMRKSIQPFTPLRAHSVLFPNGSDSSIREQGLERWTSRVRLPRSCSRGVAPFKPGRRFGFRA